MRLDFFSYIYYLKTHNFSVIISNKFDDKIENLSLRIEILFLSSFFINTFKLLITSHMINMKDQFPEVVRQLPKADIPIPGLTAYLSQDETHQIVFMYFSRDAVVSPHSHDAQWGVVLEGKIELNLEGKKQTYTKGDRFYILKGETHSAKIYAGYTSMEFFADKDRYKIKE